MTPNLSNPIVIKNRLMVQYVRAGAIFGTEDHWVFRSTNNGITWEKICKIKPRIEGLYDDFRDRIIRSGLTRWIRRNIGIHNLVVLKSGTLLIQYDGIYRCGANDREAVLVFNFRKNGVIGPLKNGLITDDLTGLAYFGEYRITRPSAVRIFRGSDDGRKWEECYRFSLSQIRHVHSIIPDPYRHLLWICTGDNNSENGLFFTADDFKSVYRLGGGNQSWRMVSLIPTEDALYWGSDAGKDAPPDQGNYIYKWDFHTESKIRLARIDKPAYFSMRLADGRMVIAVTYEPETGHKIERCADLWTSTNGEFWLKLASLPFYPSRRTYGTQYAMLCLPLGDSSMRSIYFTPLNIRHHDFRLLRLDTI